MIVIPAIDLRAGRCVRLVRGAKDAEVRYDEDPAKVALSFVEQGATFVHVVDLDGAFGEPQQRGPVTTVIKAVAAEVSVQVGGGLRDEDALAAVFEAGATRAIVGTRALREPAFLEAAAKRFGAERLCLAVDIDGEGHVRVAGWEEKSPLDLRGAFAIARGAGVPRTVVTATDRDGTLIGPNEELLRQALDAAAPDLAVVAAGGIGGPGDVAKVARLHDAAGKHTVEACVIGRALYEGNLDLPDAIAEAGAG